MITLYDPERQPSPVFDADELRGKVIVAICPHRFPGTALAFTDVEVLETAEESYRHAHLCRETEIEPPAGLAAAQLLPWLAHDVHAVYIITEADWIRDQGYSPQGAHNWPFQAVRRAAYEHGWQGWCAQCSHYTKPESLFRRDGLDGQPYYICAECLRHESYADDGGEVAEKYAKTVALLRSLASSLDDDRSSRIRVLLSQLGEPMA